MLAWYHAHNENAKRVMLSRYNVYTMFTILVYHANNLKFGIQQKNKCTPETDGNGIGFAGIWS